MSKCKNVDPLDQIVHETAENGTYHSENTYCNSEQKSFGQYMKSFGKSFFRKTVVPAFIFALGSGFYCYQDGNINELNDLIPVGSLLYALFAVSFGTGKKVDECDSSSNQPKDL